MERPAVGFRHLLHELQALVLSTAHFQGTARSISGDGTNLCSFFIFIIAQVVKLNDTELKLAVETE